MSGFLRTVGQIASVAAIVASFVPGGQVFAGVIKAAQLVKVAGAVALAANLGAQLTSKRPKNERQGLQLKFKIEPGAPIPYVIGRTATAGTVVHRQTYGTDNHYETWFVVLGGGGPYQGIETFTADRVVVPFSGTAATGYFANWMWQDRQVGLTPEPDALGHGIVSPPFGAIPAQVPGWSAQHKLSGYCATSWSMLFDTKARRYAQGEPDPSWVVGGALVYDPRLDNTRPGGSGACRWADPSDTAAHAAARATWVFSETPALHELMWALGIWQRDETNPAATYKRIMGIGAPIDLVDVDAYVEAANVQEANGWKVGGVPDSSMQKWDVLKLIAEAGGSEPVANGARLSTMVKMPRVSLATITPSDLADGTVSIPATRYRRERINGFRPRFRSEDHGWEMVPTNLIQIAEAVAEDGAPRTGSADYEFVQGATHAAQLAAYEVWDSRERMPIPIALKPKWAGRRIGQCFTLALPDHGLDGVKVLLRAREVDPISTIITLTFATETDAKHASALGQTGTVEPYPELPDPQAGIGAPSAADWTPSGVTLSANGASIPAVVATRTVTGGIPAPGNTNADALVFDYRLYVVGQGPDEGWMGASIESPDLLRKEFGTVTPGTQYQISIRYRVRGTYGDRLILGPVTTGDLSTGTDIDGGDASTEV